jgi:hypothetical protein
VKDHAGAPVVQGAHDPAPGFYVSTTSLGDHSKDVRDPGRYVDSTSVPYIALPKAVMVATGARIGDLATVINHSNGHVAHAIIADQGPAGKVGEGSMALAAALGMNANPHHGLGHGISYIMYPGSGDHHPKTPEQIGQIAGRAFHEWGGLARTSELFHLDLHNLQVHQLDPSAHSGQPGLDHESAHSWHPGPGYDPAHSGQPGHTPADANYSSSDGTVHHVDPSGQPDHTPH